MIKPKTVAFQGEPGANSHLAIREVYPRLRGAALRDLRGCVRRDRIGRGRARHDPDREFGRRPGGRHPSSDAGLRPAHHRRAFHAGEAPAAWRPKGATLDDIKTVESHVHALGQCRKVIRKLGIRPIVAADTAGSAREIAEAGDKTRAAIATRLAAEIYGLTILAAGHRGRSPQHHALHRAGARSKMGEERRRAGRSRRSCSGCATCRPRSTRRWAASPPTAST